MKKIPHLLFSAGFLAAGCAGIVSNVFAADKELLDILLGNGALSQEQYEQLLQKDELSREDVEGMAVAFGSSGMSIVSADEAFEFELGGRLHLDYALHDHVSQLAVQPNNGFTTRRSRLEMNGLFSGVWGWAAEMDFAENVVELKDFKIGYEGNNFSLYAGSQKQPYSLSLEMSSNDIPFLERSIDNYLVAELTDRAIGLRLEASGENWFFAGGVFGDEVNSGERGDAGWGSMGRIVYAPITEDSMLVHLGLRGAYRVMGDDPALRFRDRTTDFSDLHIVDTGVLRNAENVTMYGPELAVALGPLTVLGEYSAVVVGRSDGADLNFSGWHLGAALSLTGDNRASAYSMSAGEFKGIRAANDFNPQLGQWGGFELVARYASMDLNDGTFTGGSEEVFDAGLNWYPNPNIRFLFDWAHIVDTDGSNPVRLYTPGMDIYTVRAQYNY